MQVVPVSRVFRLCCATCSPVEGHVSRCDVRIGSIYECSRGVTIRTSRERTKTRDFHIIAEGGVRGWVLSSPHFLIFPGIGGHSIESDFESDQWYFQENSQGNLHSTPSTFGQFSLVKRCLNRAKVH